MRGSHCANCDWAVWEDREAEFQQAIEESQLTGCEIDSDLDLDDEDEHGLPLLPEEEDSEITDWDEDGSEAE